MGPWLGMLKEDGRPLFPAKGQFLDEGLLLVLDLQVSAAMDGMLSHRFSDVLIETWEEKVLSSLL